MAILARTGLIVLTEHGVYWRLAHTEQTDVLGPTRPQTTCCVRKNGQFSETTHEIIGPLVTIHPFSWVPMQLVIASVLMRGLTVLKVFSGDSVWETCQCSTSRTVADNEKHIFHHSQKRTQSLCNGLGENATLIVQCMRPDTLWVLRGASIYMYTSLNRYIYTSLHI